MLNKKKLASAVLVAALLSAASVAYAEDAASASYQMRLAANDPSIAARSTVAPTIDPDQPRPIKMRLRRHYVKKGSKAAARHAAPDDGITLADASAVN